MTNKASASEKFLWGLYKIYEVVGDILNIPPKSAHDAVYPEYKKLRNIWEKRKSRRTFQNLIYYLKRRGLIKEIDEKGERAWLLTEKGKDKVLKIEFKFKNYKKRKDGKWIMIIFDIPEKTRRRRDLLRRKLKFLGFKMLQKSIWVCPYDALGDVNNFIKNSSLKSHIKIFLIEEIQLNS